MPLQDITVGGSGGPTMAPPLLGDVPYYGNIPKRCAIPKDSDASSMPFPQLTPPDWQSQISLYPSLVLRFLNGTMPFRIEHRNPCRIPIRIRHQHGLRRKEQLNAVEEALPSHSFHVWNELHWEASLDSFLSDCLQPLSDPAQRRIPPLCRRAWTEDCVLPRGDRCSLADDCVIKRHRDPGTPGHCLEPYTGNRECLGAFRQPLIQIWIFKIQKVWEAVENGFGPESAVGGYETVSRYVHTPAVCQRNPWIMTDTNLPPGFVPRGCKIQPSPLQAEGACRCHCRCKTPRMWETTSSKYTGVEQRNCRPPHLFYEISVDRQKAMADCPIEPSSFELGQASSCGGRDGDIVRNCFSARKSRHASQERSDREVAAHSERDDLNRSIHLLDEGRDLLWPELVEPAEQGRCTGSSAHLAHLEPSAGQGCQVFHRLDTHLESPLSQYKRERAPEALEAVGFAPGRCDQVFIPISSELWDGSHQIIASGYSRSNAEKRRHPSRGARHIGHRKIVQVEDGPRHRKAHHTASRAEDLRFLTGFEETVSLFQGGQIRVTHPDRPQKVGPETSQRCGRRRTQSIAETIPQRTAHVKRHEIRGCGQVRGIELGSSRSNEAVGQVVVEFVQDFGCRAQARQVDTSVRFKKRPDGLPARIARHYSPSRWFSDNPRLHSQFRDDSRCHRDGNLLSGGIERVRDCAVCKYLQISNLVRDGQKTDRVVRSAGRVPLKALFFEQQFTNQSMMGFDRLKLRKLSELSTAHRTDSGRRRTRKGDRGVDYCPPLTYSFLRPLSRPGPQVLQKVLIGFHGLGQHSAMFTKTGYTNVTRAFRHRPSNSCDLGEVKPALARTLHGGCNVATFEGSDRESPRTTYTVISEGAGTAVVGVLLDGLGGPFDPRANHGVSDPIVNTLNRSDSCFRGNRDALLLCRGQKHPDRKAESVPYVLRLALELHARLGRCPLSACTPLRFRTTGRGGIRVSVGPLGRPLRDGVTRTILGNFAGFHWESAEGHGYTTPFFKTQDCR
nr:hypothetical protein [Ochlerotatus-associated narna-like virus 2]